MMFITMQQQDCPNGQLTREKFLEIYTQLFAHDNDVTNALDFCEHVFRSFDTDGSGTIDFKVCQHHHHHHHQHHYL